MSDYILCTVPYRHKLYANVYYNMIIKGIPVHLNAVLFLYGRSMPDVCVFCLA